MAFTRYLARRQRLVERLIKTAMFSACLLLTVVQLVLCVAKYLDEPVILSASTLPINDPASPRSGLCGAL